MVALSLQAACLGVTDVGQAALVEKILYRYVRLMWFLPAPLAK